MESELSKVLNHNVDSFVGGEKDIVNTSIDSSIGHRNIECYDFGDDDKNESKKENTVFSYAGAKNYFIKNRELLGFIIKVNLAERTFKTLFHDSNLIEREIDFSFEDVQQEDWDKIKVNQSIIFIYGKQVDHGTEYNVSKIYFRKSKKWTSHEIKSREIEAEALFDFFNKDGNK